MVSSSPLPQYSEIRDLHLELTERCNAACPMCARNPHGRGLNPNLMDSEVTIEKFREWFPSHFIKQLDSARLCGNFGDPGVAADCLEIAETFRAINPSIALTMNTNGSIRESRWWFRLARLFRGKYDAVLFAIDGLTDTHSIYRRGTNFQHVLRNAQSFMRGGGNAHWVFLIFEHNEHQLEDARTMAQQLGFARFLPKRTKRFVHGTSGRPEHDWSVENRGEKLYSIRPPSNPALRHPNLAATVDAKCEVTSSNRIVCRSRTRNSIYVSAAGLVFPCCWTASSLYTAVAEKPGGEVLEMLPTEESRQHLSLHHHPLDKIVEGDFFTTSLPNAWLGARGPTQAPRVCSRICGENAQAFKEQFIESSAISSGARK